MLNYPRVTSIIQSVLDYDGIFAKLNIPFEQLGNSAASELKAAIKLAADNGTNIHAATEYFDKGTLDTDKLDEALATPLLGWDGFIKMYKPQFSHIEERLYSKRYGYTGMIDRIGLLTFDGQKDNYIVDIKSGAVTPLAAIQTAAYRLLASENGIICNRKRIVVQLNIASPKFKIHIHNNPNDEAVFISALNCYNWRIQNGKQKPDNTQ